MWHTQKGDRVLTGEEAKVFLASLRFMVDILEDDDLEDAWTFRVEVFDRLTLGQKLTMLRDVAQALLDPTIPMPELSAVNEGTIAAVYQNLLNNTLMECDEDDDTQVDQSFRYYWRSLIMEAVKEADQAENVSPDPDWNPTIESNDMGDWDILVQCLENRILWMMRIGFRRRNRRQFTRASATSKGVPRHYRRIFSSRGRTHRKTKSPSSLTKSESFAVLTQPRELPSSYLCGMLPEVLGDELDGWLLIIQSIPTIAVPQIRQSFRRFGTMVARYQVLAHSHTL